jgi:creatinine amidohydrolase
MKLADLTQETARSAIEAGAVALWPAGATESHGPHLPLGTDAIIAEHTCQRAMDPLREELGLQAILLPTLALTVTEYARPFTGTLSVSKAAAAAYVRDVLVSASQQGFRCVCLVNAHLEPAHRFALRDAVKAARDAAACPLALADPCDRRWVPELTEEFQSGSCHGGRYETSLVMAATPELVHEPRRATLPARDIDLVGAMKKGLTDFVQMGAHESYFGDPAAATTSEGEGSFATLARIVVRVVKEALT